MRLAYYIDTVIPTTRANMVHVMKMCQAFSELDHEVTLFCDTCEKKLDVSDIRKQYGVSDKFNICPVQMPVVLRKYGHRLGAYYGAWKKAQIELNIDCVYSRSAAVLFFLKEKKHFVYEAHMEPDRVNRWIERAILNHPNCVSLVVISRALKQRYLELFPFLNEEKVVVLHDAADVVQEKIISVADLNGRSAGTKIGYIGHLYPGKCMETIVPLAKECLQYDFHIVGGTREWIEYWRGIVKEEHLKNVYFYGHIDNSRIGAYYCEFDIAILPFSKSIKIGKNGRSDIGRWISPLKLFEAMSYGKPIITSRLETIEEVMCDGEDCIMADPDNIDDWVQKLTMLCENPQLQKKIGAAAKEKLQKEYTWLERARKAAQLFED